jgi:hypothetical protein
MNERVRQLVRQAGLDDADFPIENWDNVPLAKFAQLIVRECVDIANDTRYDGKVVANRIKFVFGVES